MSFFFNFPNPGESDNVSSEKSETEKSSLASEDVMVAKCREIFPSLKEKDYNNVAVLSYRLSDDCIHYYDSQTVQKTASDSLSAACSVSQAMQSHSDIIPNVYEGGLKVWECAIDLLEFLQNAEISFVGKSVLELGCGAGLPGILAAKQGAALVHFQDYNSDVLEFYTIANVRLNQIEESGKCTCRYFSGDWSSFQEQSHSILGETLRYDIILTAETIYKTENYSKLISVFKSCLAKDGIVYLAAKSNYFGVGGGTRDFEQFVKKHSQFASEVCRTIEAGVPREIIQLTHQE
ncbi:hypothetical protein CHS0354_017371 [Potamilus streckersoni]|uniref:protein-histidine N-methyltransferase n=1 Tax=Potamilus streckersoni TaxID=2493646 RepID=A0AAE0T5J8_9BIVA|nr:hypothetical protein CHS0354_017371 [Potamilus streckersoni]